MRPKTASRNEVLNRRWQRLGKKAGLGQPFGGGLDVYEPAITTQPLEKVLDSCQPVHTDRLVLSTDS